MESVRAQLKAVPDSITLMHDLADIYQDIASVQSRRGEYSVALSFAGRRLTLLQELAGHDIGNDDLQIRLVETHVLIGQCQADLADLEAARSTFGTAESIAQELLRSKPDKDTFLKAMHDVRLWGFLFF